MPAQFMYGQGRLTQTVLIAVLGGALMWVWWRRRMEDLWRHPQHAPLSAQWLKPNWPDHAPYDPERDLRILEAMSDQIEPYLVEEELLWPISGRVAGGMPRMTLGGFLLREHRLNGLASLLDAAQYDRFAAARRTFHAALAQWPVNGTRKLSREAEMRVNLLDQFLRDCNDTISHNCFDYWPSQAEQRTTLLHIHAALSAGPLADRDQATSLQAALARVDSGLRRYLQVSDTSQFLWDPALEAVYPRREYWWLWVVPPQDDTL